VRAGNSEGLLELLKANQVGHLGGSLTTRLTLVEPGEVHSHVLALRTFLPVLQEKVVQLVWQIDGGAVDISVSRQQHPDVAGASTIVDAIFLVWLLTHDDVILSIIVA